MTETSGLHGDDTQDGELLADLFDALLQEILDGRTPDLAAIHPDRPDLRERIQKTWALACSVAGRREPSRPVLGGYEIERELGHGGMGTVYLARHQALNREVAIKVLPHSLAMSPRAKQRFLEEARALARLRHDHVVHIHRIIDHEEMLAFEMEYVAGGSLRSLVVELAQKAKPQSIQCLAEVLHLPPEALGTRNSIEWFVRLGIRVARALGEVHRHGLIHRDVKPSNILLRKNGQPVLADFGLARAGDPHATQAAFAGTPVYAAPERLRSGDADLDARADVYSLGVTLYEALTLGPSFGGSTTNEVLRRIEEGNLPSLRKRAPNVSRDLETVIAKAMEPDRRHRYATADEFADDLERLLSLQPIHAKPAGALRRAAKFLRRHNRVAIAAVAGAFLVAAVTWPVIAHARSAELSRERAAALVLDARSHLLRPENLTSSWATVRDRNRDRIRHTPATKAAKLGVLDAALADYDPALAQDPDDTLRLERAVVALVRLFVAADDRVDEHLLAPALANLPPLTALVARQSAAREEVGTALDRAVAVASTVDRYAAGLFAFLLNDPGACRRCWRGIGELGGAQTFLDACVALQMADDGEPERAYPRLFHAARAMPKATALMFAIADAAVASGDVDLAEQWFRALPARRADEEPQTRRRRLEADLLVAKRDLDGARRIYRELMKADPSNPEPLQRLAALAITEGDQATALRLYRELERRWPDLVQPRYQLARLALQKHDLRGYLQQARRVLAEDLHRYSSNAAMQLADILRLGGLQASYAQASASFDVASRPWRDDALPLSAWMSPRRIDSLENGLRFWATYDRAAEAASRDEERPVAIALQSAHRTLRQLPGLALGLPMGLGPVAIVALPALVESGTVFLTPLLLPFQTVLGTRLHFFENRILVSKSLNDWKQSYGIQVLRVADTNGDTLPELCIAAPPTGVNQGGGYVEMRNLADGSLSTTFEAPDDDTAWGRAIANLGDVDGDLCDDIVIGSPINSTWATAPATVTLKSGRTGTDIWTIEGNTIGFGCSLASIGDVDGDGIRDVLVGEPPTQLNGEVLGVVHVCSGRTGRQIHELVSPRDDVWFGAAVADAGDANGDGIDDVLVGGNFGNAPGVVAVYDGRTGDLLSTLAEEDRDTTFAFCVTALHDVDGDGLADIAVGAPALSSDGRLPGKVHVFSSRTGRVVHELRGDRPGDGFGFGLCWLPTWRRSDESCIAVSARQGGPVGGGYVRVSAARDGEPLQTFASAGSTAFGFSMVDLGDLDGDGLRDLGISAIRPSGVVILSMSFADIAPKGPK